MTDIPLSTTKKIIQKYYGDKNTQKALLLELESLINEGWTIKHAKEIYSRGCGDYFIELPVGYYEIEVYKVEKK